MSNIKKTILIVEDDLEILNSYKDIVSDAGYNVFTAVDGYVGLELIEKHNNVLDLILLDLMMPGVDGLELLDRVKKNPKKYGNPKVLVLSALSSESVVKEAFAKKADGYLLKAELEDGDLILQISNLLK